MKDDLTLKMNGHVLIKDDLGNVLVDKHNAIHPANMSRVISRSLAKESNFWIHKIAFGNGGTNVSPTLSISYNDPQIDSYSSTLYNETYSEIIDDSSILIGTGPGANPSGDPTSIEHVSGPGVRSQENGTVSQVIISVTLNPDEPTGQASSNNLGSEEDPDNDFTFDEIGLFTTGLPASPTAGIQSIDVGVKEATSDTGLSPSSNYNFTVNVNSTGDQLVSITTPASGSGSLGQIVYSDLIDLINTSGIIGATAAITDPDNSIQTFGLLQLISNSTGPGSTVLITDPGVPYASTFLFAALADFGGIATPEDGVQAGVQNNPITPSLERERMVSHVIFSPVNKNSNRVLTVTYTITVSVANAT